MGAMMRGELLDELHDALERATEEELLAQLDTTPSGSGGVGWAGGSDGGGATAAADAKRQQLR